MITNFIVLSAKSIATPDAVRTESGESAMMVTSWRSDLPTIVPWHEMGYRHRMVNETVSTMIERHS